MTTGLTAMNGLYGTYGMQNYYNNPYFLQAYNSPNYNQMIAQQQMYAQQPATNTIGQVGQQSGLQIPSGSNVNFQGSQNAITSEAKEEKSGNGLAWLLGIGATAITACWWLASRGKARNATGIWNQIKLGATSLFNNPKILKGADIAKHKNALNLNEALKWTDDAANLKGFQFELTKPDGALQKFGYNNGKVVGKAYEGLDETLKKQIDNIIEVVKGKDLSKLPEGVSLKNITYTSNLNNGVGFFRALTPEAVDNFKFARAYL